jgi:uncharacterized membrane protein
MGSDQRITESEASFLMWMIFSPIIITLSIIIVYIIFMCVYRQPSQIVASHDPERDHRKITPERRAELERVRDERKAIEQKQMQKELDRLHKMHTRKMQKQATRRRKLHASQGDLTLVDASS